MKNKMEQMFIKFGKVGVIIYFTIFFLTFFGIWCALSFGVDIKSWSFFSGLELLEKVGVVGLAYAATKITQPVRIILTVALASFFVSRNSEKTDDQVREEFIPPTSTEEKGENHE